MITIIIININKFILFINLILDNYSQCSKIEIDKI